MSFKPASGYTVVNDKNQPFTFCHSEQIADTFLDEEGDKVEPAILCPRDSIVFESAEEFEKFWIWSLRQGLDEIDDASISIETLLAEFRASTVEGKS